MTENPYTAFSDKMLDLWQEQLAQAMSDTRFVQAMLDMMQNMPHFGAHASSSNPAQPASASDIHERRLSELAARLERIEERLERLEGMAQARAGSSAKPSAKHSQSATKIS